TTPHGGILGRASAGPGAALALPAGPGFCERKHTVTVNVGVIGVGMIGQDHIRLLTRVLSRARVPAITDGDPGRAKSVGEGLPGEVRVHENGQDLISDDGVDAVVVTS